MPLKARASSPSSVAPRSSSRAVRSPVATSLAAALALARRAEA
jgi:hypothetical protein